MKAILAMRLLVASGMPASRPKPLTMLSTPGAAGRRSAGQHQDGDRGGFGGLEHDAVAGADGGASFQAAIRIGKFQG